MRKRQSRKRILRLLSQGREIKITFKLYRNDYKLAIHRRRSRYTIQKENLTHQKETSKIITRVTVNLSQL